MPMYDFACEPCGVQFEEIVPSTADPPPCPECGKPTEKLMSAVFVGKGLKKISPKAKKYLSPQYQAKLKDKAAREGRKWGPPK